MGGRRGGVAFGKCRSGFGVSRAKDPGFPIS